VSNQLNQSSGLNNVTRSLAINTYQLYEFEDREAVEHWFRSFEKQFSVDRLSAFITTLGNAIGAKILNVSSTPYKPYGASAALLVAQDVVAQAQHHIAHLDASHIAAHSYFDAGERVAQFRLEIEISTCGAAHPCSLIDSVLRETKADFVQLDYRVRGLAWHANGEPDLAADKLTAGMCSVDGYESFFESSTGRGGSYVELIRSDLPNSLDQLIEKMRR